MWVWQGTDMSCQTKLEQLFEHMVATAKEASSGAKENLPGYGLLREQKHMAYNMLGDANSYKINADIMSYSRVTPPPPNPHPHFPSTPLMAAIRSRRWCTESSTLSIEETREEKNWLGRLVGD